MGIVTRVVSDDTTRRGRLTISRVSSNVEDDFVRIELVDQASRTEAVEIDIPLAAFANALFGRGSLPVAFRFRPERVGLRLEYKTEVIPLDAYPDRREPDDARARVAPYEVDGWIGRESDVFNHHNLSCKNDRWSVKVHFSRWVEPEPGWEPEP